LPKASFVQCDLLRMGAEMLHSRLIERPMVELFSMTTEAADARKAEAG
jgi:hypothetical protein